MSPSASIEARQRWLGLLARATTEELAALVDALPEVPEYVRLRPPETGLVMASARAGGTGQRFNLGEMTATRASVRLADGTVGHGYVAGRSPEKAELIAVADALLQTGTHAPTMHAALDVIRQRLHRENAAVRAKAAATRVSFSTLSREADL